MLRKTSIALAMAVTLATAATAETTVHETIEFRLSAGGFDAETLVIENMPVGSTETRYTEQGSQALVSRFEDRFEIELHGESLTINTPSHHEIDLHEAHEGMVWIEKDEEHFSDEEGGERHVIVKRVHGDGDQAFFSDDAKGERRIMIMNGDDVGEEELAGMLGEMHVDVEADGHQTIMIRKEIEISED